MVATIIPGRGWRGDGRRRFLLLLGVETALEQFDQLIRELHKVDENPLVGFERQEVVLGHLERVQEGQICGAGDLDHENLDEAALFAFLGAAHGHADVEHVVALRVGGAGVGRGGGRVRGEVVGAPAAEPEGNAPFVENAEILVVFGW